MKPSGNQFTYAGKRLVAAASLLATLAFAPGVVLAADPNAHEDRAETRINDMHARLRITPPQEEQWARVAMVMRENARTMDTLTEERDEQSKNMTAVDDLISYGEITDAHSDGIRKLTPEFATLYAGMSDAQKMEADTLFRRGAFMGGHRKNGRKMSDDK